jgi:hypothetical protein
LGDPLALTLVGYHGPEQATSYSSTFATNTVKMNGNNRSTVDLTGVTKIIPKVALWFQVNYGQEEEIVLDAGSGMMETATWSGATIQPVISITDKFSIGARWEDFEDHDGARTGTADASVRNYTIAPAYKMTDNMTFRIEYRLDESNKKLWVDEDGTAQDNNSTATAQWLLTF